jgi:hypothetical protein
MKLLARPEGRSLPLILAAAVLISTSPMVTGCSRGDDQPAAAPSTQEQPSVAATAVPAPPPPAAAAEPGPPPGAATPQQLQELVSPIALYPDVLVAQILAGSTYPTQVVEADRWLKQNPNLTGDQLANQVNQQNWDPSIKSLTQFPTVLQTMNDNLAWTSNLGEAYYNQPADVMNAIQVLRNMAVNAGTLKSTAQQQVEVQPAPPAAQGSTQPSVQQTVIIQPAQPNTVYVPQYNPTSAYGAPVAAPPGYSGSDLLLTGVLSFGAGILLGSLINNGHNDWNCGWYGGGGSTVKYNNNVYVTNNNVYRDDIPAAAGAIDRRRTGRRTAGIRRDQRHIRATGHLTMVAADTIVRTIRESRRRGRTTRIPRGRPIPMSQRQTSPSPAHCRIIPSGLTRTARTQERIDPIRRLIPRQELGQQIQVRERCQPSPPPGIGPLLASPPIARRTRLEASRKTIAAWAAAIAPSVDMSPAEIRGHQAIADKPASGEIKNPLVVAARLVVAEAAMPNAAAVAMAAAVMEEIGAARRRVIEEFL